VLQCVALCYSVLQRVAVCYSVLQCVAVHGGFTSLSSLLIPKRVLQCVAVCCSVLLCVVVWICSSKEACFVTAVAHQTILYHTCRKSYHTNNLILGTATHCNILQYTVFH